MRGATRRLAGAVTLLLCVWTAGLVAAAPAQAQERLRWGRLRLVAPATVDSTAWFEALDLKDRPVDEAPLPPALLRALGGLARRGYPFAEARPGSFDLNGDRITGVITVDPGPRAHITGLELTGKTITRPATAMRIAGVRPGDLYTGEEDRLVRERLARSGLFTRVGDVDVAPGEDPGDVLLRIPVREPAYTRFAGILGVSGRDARLTGLLDLELNNIAGTAREAAARWENRGDDLTRFALRYREPWLPLVPIGVSGDLTHDVRREVYSYTRWEVDGDLSWGDGWRVRLGRGGTRAVETATAGTRATEGFTLAGLELDRRNSTLVPTAGFRLGVTSRRGQKRFTVTADSLDMRFDRTRWDAEAEGYRRFGRRWLGVARARFLFLDTPEDTLPRYDLFAVGGATSLRGYREEQYLTAAAGIVQLEWRWLADARGSALYLFTDAALISPRGDRAERDSFKTFLLGTGVGVRQASRLGILGVEYGVAKGENPLDGRIHLRLDAVF